jgi:hypothetical protein
MNYDNYKYKKYSLNHFYKTFKTKYNFQNIFEDLIKYLNNIDKNKINNFDEYYKKTINKTLPFFKNYDNNVKIYIHILIDINTNNIIAFCLAININDMILDNKYYKLLKKYITGKGNILYIKNMVISSNYRGKKICNYFLARIKKNAIKNKIDYMLCEINDINVPQSAKCFLNNGFIKTDIVSYPNTNYFYIKL